MRDEVRGLAELDYAPLHLLPLDVRTGTALFRRAESRGLVEGSFAWRKYRFEDARTERVAELLLALPTRLKERSVPIALYDLGYNLGIARRLIPEAAPLVNELEATYRRIARSWNRDQIRVLQRAVAFVETGDADCRRGSEMAAIRCS